MPKSSFERALEKQQKEAKKIAEEDARRQKAATIVNGQPVICGLKLLDASSDEVFQIILSQYDGNENRHIKGNIELFPKAYSYTINLEFEKLVMYGVIAAPRIWLDGYWELFLTPLGLTYNDERATALQKHETEQVRLAHKQFDVFISHASKDKSDFVDGLYINLRRLGISIFYDTDSISWGDNWKKAILEGTAKSEFAIIVISENFFGREWTNRELNEFLQRQNESGQKIVLPILHNITRDQLIEQYPELEEIQVIDTANQSSEDITILFAKELIKRYK